MIQLNNAEKEVIKKVMEDIKTQGGTMSGDFSAENNNFAFISGVALAIAVFTNYVDREYSTKCINEYYANLHKGIERERK